MSCLLFLFPPLVFFLLSSLPWSCRGVWKSRSCLIQVCWLQRVTTCHLPLVPSCFTPQHTVNTSIPPKFLIQSSNVFLFSQISGWESNMPLGNQTCLVFLMFKSFPTVHLEATCCYNPNLCLPPNLVPPNFPWGLIFSCLSSLSPLPWPFFLFLTVWTQADQGQQVASNTRLFFIWKNLPGSQWHHQILCSDWLSHC